MALSGALRIARAGDYRYELFYKVSGGRIAGISISGRGTGIETRAAITGTVNPAGIVEFRETRVLKTDVKDPETRFCLIRSKLTPRSRAGVTVYEGRFAGSDKNGESCGTGDVYLVRKDARLSDSSRAVVSMVTDTMLRRIPGGQTRLLAVGAVNQVAIPGKLGTLRFYDSGHIDGDEIAVTYNGRQLCDKLTLSKEGHYFEFAIDDDKENIVYIKTINVGTDWPNTATIDVLAKGLKAKTYQFNAPANTVIAIKLVSEAPL